MHTCVGKIIQLNYCYYSPAAAADDDDTSTKTNVTRSTTNRMYCTTPVTKCSSQVSVPCRHCYYTQ